MTGEHSGTDKNIRKSQWWKTRNREVCASKWVTNLVQLTAAAGSKLRLVLSWKAQVKTNFVIKPRPAFGP